MHCECIDLKYIAMCVTGLCPCVNGAAQSHSAPRFGRARGDGQRKTHKVTIAIWVVLGLQIASVALLLSTWVLGADMRSQYGEVLAAYQQQKEDYDTQMRAYRDLRTQYETEMARYRKAMDEYDQQKKDYEAETQKYRDLRTQYEAEMARYRKAMDDYQKRRAGQRVRGSQ